MNYELFLKPTIDENFIELLIVYDNAIDDVLDIIDSRLEYYDCLVIADKAGEMEWEKIEELELVKDLVNELKYYKKE